MNKLFVKTMVAALILVAAVFSTNTVSAQRGLFRIFFHSRPIRRVTPPITTPIIYYKASQSTGVTGISKIKTTNLPKTPQPRLRDHVLPIPIISVMDTTTLRNHQQIPVRSGMSKASLPQLQKSLDDEVEPSRDTVCIKNDY